MTIITTRSRIRVRYTTNPAALGYADTPDQRQAAIERHLRSEPDFVGTPRQVIEFLADLRRDTGDVFCRIDLSTAQGERVQIADLKFTVREAEMAREARRRWPY